MSIPTMRIRIRVRLLAPGQGGRTHPIASDYRPNWDIGDRTADGGIVLYMGRIIDLERELLDPGDECAAAIDPYSAEGWSRVKPGDRLTLLEGPHRVVGRAVVESIEP
jgi:hypothetical protein